MKIKCPICKMEFEELHYGTDLGVHLYWQHKPKTSDDAGDVYRYYASLIFKIHEKIESISKKTPNMIDSFATEYEVADFHRNMGALQALKSLLE